MSTSAEPLQDAPGGHDNVRKRRQNSSSSDEAPVEPSQLVAALNADPKVKKTYGRTPDGTGTRTPWAEARATTVVY